MISVSAVFGIKYRLVFCFVMENIEKNSSSSGMYVYLLSLIRKKTNNQNSTHSYVYIDIKNSKSPFFPTLRCGHFEIFFVRFERERERERE